MNREKLTSLIHIVFVFSILVVMNLLMSIALIYKIDTDNIIKIIIVIVTHLPSVVLLIMVNKFEWEVIEDEA